MHEASLAATERATSSMKELVTKLKGDRVALAAQLSAAECGLRDAEDAQSAVLRDIDSLRHEISDLSAKLGAASGETNKSRSALADLQGTKIALNAQVLALREELERLGLEETKNLGLLEKSLVVDTTATCRLKSISAEIAKVQQEEASLLSEIAVLREVASSFSIQKDAYLAKMTMIEEKVRQSQQTADATAEEVKRQEKKISEVLQ
jgi:chromosome segregation ATPase